MLLRLSFFVLLAALVAGCTSPANSPGSTSLPAFQAVASEFPLLLGTLSSDSLPAPSPTALAFDDAVRWLDLNDSLRPAYPVGRVEDSAWVALVYVWASDPKQPSTVATFFTRDGQRQGHVILKGLSDETVGQIAQVDGFVWIGDSIRRNLRLIDAGSGKDAPGFSALAVVLEDGTLDQLATVEIALPANQLPAYAYTMFSGASPALALHVMSVAGQADIHLLQHEANFRLLRREAGVVGNDTVFVVGDPEVRGYVPQGTRVAVEGVRTRSSYTLVMQDGSLRDLTELQTPQQPWAQWQARYNYVGTSASGRLQLAFRPDGRTATARLLVNSGPPRFSGCEISGQVRLYGELGFLRSQAVDGMPPCQVILVNVSRQVQAFVVSDPASCACRGVESLEQTFTADIPAIASGE